MTYQLSYQPPSPLPQHAYILLFVGDEVVVRNIQETAYAIPTTNDMPAISASLSSVHFVGLIDQTPCYTASLPASTLLPSNCVLRGMRGLFGHIPDDHFAAIGSAMQIVRFDENHRFCGRCGTATIDKGDERAKECPHCGLITYPRISPAAIVAITNGNQILLAHSHRFSTRVFSIIAGFVEIGETAEQCAAREAQEEVGITIKNIRYFGTQPWPLTGSLMIAFTAEYASGEIQVDGKEITEAGWFTADRLPQVPLPMSIARKLIDWFVHGPGSHNSAAGTQA